MKSSKPVSRKWRAKLPGEILTPSAEREPDQDRFCEEMEQQKETVSACLERRFGHTERCCETKNYGTSVAFYERSGGPQAVPVHTGHSSQMPQQRNT